MTRTVVITGGTKGLGLATARTLAAPGTRLVLTYRSDEEGARKAADELRRGPAECETLRIDFTEADAPEKLAAGVRVLTETVSVYVHNAAATAFKPLLEVKAHHLQKTFDISVFSFVRNVQGLLPLMKPGSAVIAVSGIDTLQAVPRHGVLAAAKAALEMLTRYLAHELAPKGIRVNAVNPGFIPTDSTRTYLGPGFEQAIKASARLAPSGQVADPADVAAVIAFLASDQARWMVGQTLIVDGGAAFTSPAFGLSR